MGYPSISQTCRKYESSRPSLWENLKSHNVAVCVCVVLEMTGFFSYWPPHKTSYSSCSLFTAFYISLSTIFYIFLHLFVLLVFSLLLSLSRSRLCYLWLCFAVPCLLICLFLQLFTCSFSTVCISVILSYYMFIYLFICLEVLGKTTEKCIRIFKRLLNFQLKCHDIPAC